MQTSDIIKFFVHRTDVLAIQASGGFPMPCYLEEHDATVEDAIEEHLLGTSRFGAYTPAPSGQAKWFCIDIDGGDHANRVDDPGEVLAELLEALIEEGLHPYWEISGSGEGYHIWCFFENAQAADLIDAYKGIIEPFGEGVEFYPKSPLPPKLGNLVWLPCYGGGQALFDVDGELVKVPAYSDAPPASARRAESRTISRWTRTSQPPTLAKTKDALGHLGNPDADYDTWFRVLAALHNDFGEESRDLAYDWSSASSKHSDAKFEKTWGSLDSGDGLTARYILWLARREGWKWDGPDVQEAVHDEDSGLVLVPESKSDFDIANMILHNLELDGEVRGGDHSLWQYDARRGVWGRIPDEEVYDYIFMVNGLFIAEKPLHLSKGKIDSIKDTINLVTKSWLPWPDETPGAAFRNGFVGDGGIEPHSPEHFCRLYVDAEWGCEARSVTWERFLDFCFADCTDEERKARKDVLGEYVGACVMNRAMDYGRVCYLKGPGATGKSTFLSVIRQMFPEEVTSGVPPQDVGRPTGAVSLLGSRLNILEELDPTSMARTAAFKSAISGEPLRMKFLYKDEFTSRSRAGWMMAGNVFPDSVDMSSGFWRRWLIVPFENVVAPEDRDIELKDKLAAEMAGIWAWALDGWSRLKRQGRYTEIEGHAEAVEEWRYVQDPTYEFIDTHSVMFDTERRELWTQSSAVYTRYVRWCRKNRIAPDSQTSFSMSLKEMGIQKERRAGGIFWCLAFRD